MTQTFICRRCGYTTKIKNGYGEWFSHSINDCISNLRSELRIMEERAIAAENEVARLSWLIAGGKEVTTGSETPTQSISIGAGGSVYPVGRRETETRP